jgi:hypothetical protein
VKNNLFSFSHSLDKKSDRDCGDITTEKEIGKQYFDIQIYLNHHFTLIEDQLCTILGQDKKKSNNIESFVDHVCDLYFSLCPFNFQANIQNELEKEMKKIDALKD